MVFLEDVPASKEQDRDHALMRRFQDVAIRLIDGHALTDARDLFIFLKGNLAVYSLITNVVRALAMPSRDETKSFQITNFTPGTE